MALLAPESGPEFVPVPEDQRRLSSEAAMMEAIFLWPSAFGCRPSGIYLDLISLTEGSIPLMLNRSITGTECLSQTALMAST